MEIIEKNYENKTGSKLEIIYGASGTILSQMELSKRGDIYIAGSPDFMEKAKQKKIVYSKPQKILAYLIPAIIVQKGNPKKITNLKDLLRPDISVGIGNPESVCVGTYAIEILKRKKLLNKIKKNIKVYFESCANAMSLLAMKKVDAIIGWREQAISNVGFAKIVLLKPKEIPRIAYISAAISVYTKPRKPSQDFLLYLASKESIAIFEKYGYITKREETLKFTGTARIYGAH